MEEKIIKILEEADKTVQDFPMIADQLLNLFVADDSICPKCGAKGRGVDFLEAKIRELEGIKKLFKF